jgi:transposase-like protein
MLLAKRMNFIKKNEGLRVSQISKSMSIPPKTIERWISSLKKERKIEFLGNKKNGVYYASNPANPNPQIK